MRPGRFCAFVLGIGLLVASPLTADPGTGFTWQGRVTSSGTPMNAVVHLRFQLFDAATGGTQVGPTLTHTNVQLVGGLATLELNFGNQFNGSPRWLQIQIDGDAGAASFTPLSPRRPLRPVPYAITATNTLTGGGPGDLHSLNAADNDPIDVVYVTNDGNVGVGTTTAQAPLHIVSASSSASDSLLLASASRDGQGGFDRLDDAIGVDANGNLAAVTALVDNAVTFVNISDPSQPTVISTIQQGGVDSLGGTYDFLNDPLAVALGTNLAFVLSPFDDAAITAVDITNPAAPLFKSVLVDGGTDSVGNPTTHLLGARYLEAVGTTLFVACRFEDAVMIVDYSDPANPVLLSELVDNTTDSLGNPLHLFDPFRLAVDGSNLYVTANFDDTVSIFDISDLTDPILLYELQNGGTDSLGNTINDMQAPFGVDVSNNILFVTTPFGDDTLLAFDVSNPAAPVLQSTIADGFVDLQGNTLDRISGTFEVDGDGPLLYVSANGDGAVTVVDYTDPQNPLFKSVLVDGQLDAAGQLVDTLETFNYCVLEGGYYYNASVVTDSLTILGFVNPQASLLVEGASSFRDNVSVDGNAVVSGILNANGQLAVAGTSTFEGNISTQQNELRLYDINDGNHGLGWFGTFSGGTPFAGMDVNGPVLWGFTGGLLGTRQSGVEVPVMRWTNTGIGVGLGTGNPERPVDAQGPLHTVIRATSNSTVGSWLELRNTDTGGTTWSLLSTGSANGGGAGNLVVDGAGGSRAVITGAGNVGIGTLTPAQRLHVVGNVQVGNSVIGSGSLGLSGDSTGGTDINITNDGYVGVGGTAFNDVRFTIHGAPADDNLLQVRSSGGTDRFLVTHTGQSGFNALYSNIGLTARATPGDVHFLRVEDSTGTAQFHVNGNAASVELNELRLGGIDDGHHGLAYKGSVTSNFAGVDVNGPALWGFAGGLLGTRQGLTETSVMRWTNTGVGIGQGTAAPERPLDVQGTGHNVMRATSNSTIGSWLELRNTDTGGATWSLLSTGSANGGGAGNLVVDSGGSKAVITSAGNVGIGTLSPASRLHVAGNVRVANSVLGSGALELHGDGTGGPDMTIDANGRTGIATSPAVNTRLTVDAGSGDQTLLRARNISDIVRFIVQEDGHSGFNQIYTNVALTVREIFGDGTILHVEDAVGTTKFQVAIGLVTANTNFTVTNGTKLFTIDHPQDPANKVLRHNTVEGPGYYTFYKGNVALDAKGEAWADLPTYCESLNTNWNYQLTAIGASMPGLHVAEEVKENKFKISGGVAGKKVSWQVTADRNDPFAQDHPFEAELPKGESEKGRYHYPAGYKKSPELAIGRFPETKPVTGEEPAS